MRQGVRKLKKSPRLAAEAFMARGAFLELVGDGEIELQISKNPENLTK